MLLRQAQDGVIAISQPAHAWVSGQLARAWGNAEFGTFTLREEVCFAADQHDIGFLEWESAPTLNRETGLPHTFLELPTALHLDIWSRGIQDLLRLGRYPALLVSLHFAHLCKVHGARSPENVNLEQQFLKDQQALQNTLLTSLGNDFHYAPFVESGDVQRQRELVSTWDILSLLLCTGLGQERSVEDVPTASGKGSLRLVPKSPDCIAVTPWPFKTGGRPESVELVCEGRRLLKKFSRQDEMRKALRDASPVTVLIELAPGAESK